MSRNGNYVVWTILIHMLLTIQSIQGYKCYSQRFPFNIGTAAGDTEIVAMSYVGSDLIVGGHTLAADLFVDGSSQKPFILSFSTSALVVNWSKKFIDPSGDDYLQIYKME